MKAVELYSKSAEQGYVVAIFNLGVMCENGTGLEQDYAHAARFYEAAAEAELAPAQFSLGVLLALGQGVDPNLDKAKAWFRRAADQGHKEAAKNLERLESGEDVVKDNEDNGDNGDNEEAE